jgi:hypothetical protein
MAKSKFFSLWGQKAEDDKPAETDEEKAAREKAEKEAADKKAADEAAKASSDDEEDEEEEDDEEDKATAEAAAKVPAKLARHIRRAERARLHAIVDGAGPDRVEAALHVGFNTNMDAKAAVAMIQNLPASTAAAGRLGLRAAMNERAPTTLGPAGGSQGKGDEVDKLAQGIAAFAVRDLD